MQGSRVTQRRARTSVESPTPAVMLEEDAGWESALSLRHSEIHPATISYKKGAPPRGAARVSLFGLSLRLSGLCPSALCRAVRQLVSLSDLELS